MSYIQVTEFCLHGMQRLQRPKILVHAIRKILNEMKTNSPLHRAKAAAKGHLHANTASYSRDLSTRLFLHFDAQACHIAKKEIVLV